MNSVTIYPVTPSMKKWQLKSEELAEQAFAKMDTQLDLSIFPVLLSLSLPFIINASD